MSKRAAIYIRVSTEHQAEQVSPATQEADCRAYCDSRGYYISEVYRDTEKFRSGKRMVEPSGTRSDRPQLKRMLADSDAGLFDVLIAWREDRLYRGINSAVLWISDRVKNKTMEVELAKEFYDPKTAAVKAWAAGVELDAKHDRLEMGVSNRFSSGKVWNNNTPYGYKLSADEYLVEDEIEASWLRKIYEWFGSGDSAKTIRLRLINGGAPQRSEMGKVPWHIMYIYRLLKRNYYYTGVKTQAWNKNQYEITIPIIIDMKTAEQVKGRFAAYKKYPCGNLRERSLAAGLIFCKACGTRMTVKRYSNLIYYTCNRMRETAGDRAPGCAAYRNISLLDAELWEKVWNLISEPGKLEEALEKRIQELQAEETDAGAAVESLERRLSELTIERQQVITWARQKRITEQDLDIQLSVLDGEERDLYRDLDNKRLLVGDRAERLIALAQETRALAIEGWEAVNGIPEDEDQARLQFEFRKKIVQSCVTRVEVSEDKSITVYTEFDFGENISIPSAYRQYTDIFKARAFRVSLVI